MMSRSQYYEKKLYRLQDGILRVCADTGTPFYLTGGTALSRAYYHHRYSDDLDLFVNNDDNFSSYVNMILENLKIKGFDFDESALAISESFVSLYTYKPGDDLEIKVDFVNDIAVRYGEFNASPIYPKTDNIRNILSNKIGAVFRLSGKDIADIREIALHEKFDWAEVLIEARNKDMGVEANIISEIIAAIPKSAFESIAWVTQPSWSEFMKDIETISEDLIHCSQNSLVQ